MRFEWDSDKDRVNRKRHGGIAFESAALVFNDPHVIFSKDRIVDGEQRWHAIGAAEEAVLLVVHAYRMEDENGEEETVRIISARQANQRERRVYLRQTTG
ncbi:MAG: BrnT family toxin [Bryobacterales bacterium]|nr:BrnT family toxin [Bryobacterales bacterium]